jgi:cytochrome c553
MKKRQKGLKRIILCVSFIYAVLANALVMASTPTVNSILSLKANINNGKDVYMTCSFCHSPQGWGTPDGYYPQLSGQLAAVLAKQLMDIQSGNRDVPTMIPFANAIFYRGNQDVADVIAYISSLPMNPDNTKGSGDNLAQGEKYYRKDCKRCHGEKAQGNNDKHYPLLQGQHYPYLLRQMKWIKNGQRKNGDADMAKVLRSYSEQDMQAVADYISRIKPPANKLAKSSAWKNPDFDNSFVSAPWVRHQRQQPPLQKPQQAQHKK